MHWTEIPGLSQEHMEQFFIDAMKPDSHLLHHGVIPRMDPRFVSCDHEKGTLDVAYDVQAWELNPEDVIHGGMISRSGKRLGAGVAHVPMACFEKACLAFGDQYGL